jgi:hypothetical protein
MNNLVKFQTVLMLLMASAMSSYSQVKIGDNPETINASSLLELESSTKGVVLPRMTSGELKDIVNPPNGMIVYNTSDSIFYYYHNQWTALRQLISLKDDTITLSNDGGFVSLSAYAKEINDLRDCMSSNQNELLSSKTNIELLLI